MISLDGFIDLLKTILDSNTARALALSKGGWEEWLQCELWNAVSDASTTVEREVKYPGYNLYGDLVCRLDSSEHWIELKAFGYFQKAQKDRFLDSFANDVQKLGAAPQGSGKMALLIVPKNIGEELVHRINERWTGIKQITLPEMLVFFIRFF